MWRPFQNNSHTHTHTTHTQTAKQCSNEIFVWNEKRLENWHNDCLPQQLLLLLFVLPKLRNTLRSRSRGKTKQDEVRDRDVALRSFSNLFRLQQRLVVSCRSKASAREPSLWQTDWCHTANSISFELRCLCRLTVNTQWKPPLCQYTYTHIHIYSAALSRSHAMLSQDYSHVHRLSLSLLLSIKLGLSLKLRLR